MNTRISDFHFFLRSVSQRFTSMAIFNADFKCLHINTPYSNNSVGLMTGLKTLKNFFPWDGSQIVVYNDPLLGCSQNNRVQFLFSCDSFHFCIEESFYCRWDFTKKMIKIPPIPIVEHNRMSIQLIDALTSQADCPIGMKDFFSEIIQKIEKFRSDFKSILKAHESFAGKDLHKSYLALASQSSLKVIKSKTYVSSQVEYEFDSNSILKLKASTSESGIKIDFQGTTNHTSIQMADPITDSICFSFFADYFQFNDLMNEATFSHFQIAKPTQSFVNSKNFSHKIYSDYCGTDLLNQALLDSWSEKINLKPHFLMKSYFQASSTDSILEFNLANSKPAGSTALAYQFEPLLASRPTPGLHHIPNLDEFNHVGLNVRLSQYQFRSAKANETNDFQAILNLECIKPTQLTIMTPCLPLKIKSNRPKSAFVKPLVTVNNETQNALSIVKNLVVGDEVLVKSGVIDFV